MSTPISAMPVVREGVSARRVRHQARDGLFVMAFSLGASCLVALLLMTLANVGG